MYWTMQYLTEVEILSPASMRQAGIVYASEQIIDLIANGINHIHVYSMNKPDVAKDILGMLCGIID